MSKIKPLAKEIRNSDGISYDEALELVRKKIASLEDLFEFLEPANRLRQINKGKAVITCSIVNAKSGGCGEDCAFCSQSAHHDTDTPKFPLISPDEIITRAKEAERLGAKEFSIVTSGRSVKSSLELSSIEKALNQISTSTTLARCASLGAIGPEDLKRLKAAGLQIFHHNLETNRSFFPQICSTHSYEDKLKTIRVAKEEGLRVCCGGIFGMGETWEQRIELAFELKDLEVDSIPVNFLNPIKGTRLEGQKLLGAYEALKIIALVRLIYPKVDIVICGGREVTLGDLQPLIFFAGANGVLIGDYLTTKGQDAQEDLKMIEDLGLKPKGCVP